MKTISCLVSPSVVKYKVLRGQYFQNFFKKRKFPISRIPEEIEAKQLFYSCHRWGGEELCPEAPLKGPSVPSRTVSPPKTT